MVRFEEDPMLFRMRKTERPPGKSGGKNEIRMEPGAAFMRLTGQMGESAIIPIHTEGRL